ncbi:hypothetical protein GCM10022295_91570 [Streptomyces osmaniensis]|uniref:Transposase n=1 Tax=Streptomyces osmaniensis TaxID=593134 RepID=A0ABP6Z3P6_9ACTN
MVALADLTRSDPSGAEALAVDGKSALGSRRGRLPAAHLLAAMTGDGRTVTQLRVPDKANEITCFAAPTEAVRPGRDRGDGGRLAHTA